jgi:predicted outer membrane protein
MAGAAALLCGESYPRQRGAGGRHEVRDCRGESARLDGSAHQHGRRHRHGAVGWSEHQRESGAGGSQLSRQDRTFIVQNAQTNLVEITTGKLAAQRGTTASIRQAGQMFRTQHQQVLSKLRDVAQRVKVKLPSSPNAMQQRQARQEKAASGAAFDRIYVHNEIMGHQMSIRQTRQEIKSGSDRQVVEFAKSYLPIAEKHLHLLRQLEAPAVERSECRLRCAGGQLRDAPGRGAQWCLAFHVLGWWSPRTAQ